MALIKCSECGKEVSEYAASCPNCGNPIKSATSHISPQPQSQTTPQDHPLNHSQLPPHPKKQEISPKLQWAIILTFIIVVWGAFHNSKDEQSPSAPSAVTFPTLNISIPQTSQSLKKTTKYVIPGRYELLVYNGANPSQLLEKDSFLADRKNEFTRANVEQFQFAIYDKGEDEDDGPRAMGELRKGKDTDVYDFIDLSAINDKGITPEKAKKRKKLVESGIGYNTTPQELYAAYSNNEVVADDDFKGKPIIMQNIPVLQISKDILGKPYITVPLTAGGFSGLHIYFDNRLALIGSSCRFCYLSGSFFA